MSNFFLLDTLLIYYHSSYLYHFATEKPLYKNSEESARHKI